MASRPPITLRARMMDMSERAATSWTSQVVHSSNGMAEANENRYENEERHQAHAQRRDSALNLPRTDRTKSTNHTADPKKQICAELRALVNQDDSDKAFEEFRNRPEFQHAFRTEKERKAAKATRSQTAGRQQYKGNILHQLVVDSQDWDLADISKVLARIFKGPGDSKANRSKPSAGQFGLEELLEDDIGNGTPVFLALENGTNCNTRFIHALLNLSPPPSNLGQVFCKQSTHHNEPYCLHAALNLETRDNFDDIKKIIELMNDYKLTQNSKSKPAQSSKPKQRGKKPSVPKPISPFEITNKSGDTPLHLAIRAAPIPGVHDIGQLHEHNPDEPRFFKPEEAVELIEKLIDAHPDALGVKQQVSPENRPSAGRRSLGRTPYQERIFLLAEEFKRNDESSNNEDRDSRLYSPVPGIEDKQLSVRDYLFRDDFRRFVIKDPVASYISYYCIRHLPREKAMTYLYRRGEELATEFDLLGFPREAIDHIYLQRLETHVRFEQTLKYVALPRLAYLTPTATSSRSQLATSLTKPADLTPIFNWLYDRHVRKIERVTVVEDRDAPHQDSTIVECLKRFKVEIWEWEKMDISSEVISQSSKFIREIRLHSSGNEAVLRGWGAQGGFGDRTKFPELTDIHVSFYEGQEDRKTLDKYGAELTDALENPKAERLVERATALQKLTKQAIELADAMMAVGYSADPKENTVKISQMQCDLEQIKKQAADMESDDHTEKTNGLTVDCAVIPRGMRGSASVSDRRAVNTGEIERITRIKELTTFFRNTVARKRDPPEGTNLEITAVDASEKAVKIAVIDDGMDPALHIVDGKYAKVFAGNSFCTSNSDSRNAYFVPLSSHGTRVASVICQICPKVDLCIARLDEQNLRAGERTITARSAAKAIQWVTERGVDIICMSWTIEASSDDDSDLRSLQKAIKKANKRGIIMFCSASDQGGSSNLNCYPGAWSDDNGSSYCIRIGSSSSSDNASIWVNDAQVDFLLPGENILIKDSDGTSEYQTGSSYATAVAVGLAGLLLYSSLALGSGSPPSAQHMGEEDEEEDEDAEDNNADAGGEDEDDESDSSSDEGSLSGRTATSTDQDPNVIKWDGGVMNTMFKNMVYSAGRAKKMLVMPEKYMIAAIKKGLKTNQGLEKLKWDEKFQAVLRNLLQELGKRTTN